MAVPKDLLEIMACPLCKAEVRLRGDEIACTRTECGLVFVVKDDIPVMLIDEAKRPCPKCGAQRDWEDRADTLRCAKCGTTFRPARD